MAEYSFQKPRRLDESRSYLGFYYPEPDNRVTKIILPFYENPTILENQKSRLVEYNPLGRSSSLFTYTGAESRQFNISFNVTLNHLEFFYSNWEKYVNQVKEKTKEEKKTLFTRIGLGLEDQGSRKAALVASEYVNYDDIPISRNSELRNKAISTIAFWTNIIRSSVINNSINPIYGPPIVRINFGILYRDVPCVCRDYKIEFDEVAGYDVATLLSRKIKFSLSLAEIRVGKFSRFYPGVEGIIYHRDNLTGWESIIGDTNEIDPNPLRFNDE